MQINVIVSYVMKAMYWLELNLNRRQTLMTAAGKIITHHLCAQIGNVRCLTYLHVTKNARTLNIKTHLMMTYITKQLPTKPTTNTTEYTATMMGMMGDIGSGSASQVPFGV